MTVFWQCPECELIFCFRDEFRHEKFMLCKCCGSEWIVESTGEATPVSTADDLDFTPKRGPSWQSHSVGTSRVSARG